MAIKIDSEGTSVFPAVEAIDVRDTGRETEVIFATRVEGQLVPVTRFSSPLGTISKGLVIRIHVQCSSKLLPIYGTKESDSSSAVGI